MTVMGLLPPMPMGDENDDNPYNTAARTTMLVDGGYVTIFMLISWKSYMTQP